MCNGKLLLYFAKRFSFNLFASVLCMETRFKGLSFLFAIFYLSSPEPQESFSVCESVLPFTSIFSGTLRIASASGIQSVKSKE